MWYDEEDDDIDGSRLTFSNDQRHRLKLSLPADVHLPNKNEAKTLRKIMSETGLTEKEVRAIHKYRKQLSEASKVKKGKSKLQRVAEDHLKEITKVLKLPKKHPTVVEAFKKELQKEIADGTYFSGRYTSRNIGYAGRPSINNILQLLKMI
jgi:hypothetical protein